MVVVSVVCCDVGFGFCRCFWWRWCLVRVLDQKGSLHRQEKSEISPGRKYCPFFQYTSDIFSRNGFYLIQKSKKSPTGPTERTPKPEHLIAPATYLGVRWQGPIPFLMEKATQQQNELRKTHRMNLALTRNSILATAARSSNVPNLLPSRTHRDLNIKHPVNCESGKKLRCSRKDDPLFFHWFLVFVPFLLGCWGIVKNGNDSTLLDTQGLDLARLNLVFCLIVCLFVCCWGCPKLLA